MERVMIYPYNRAYLPYIHHQSLMDGFQITSAVSPRGWGMIGDKIDSSETTLTVTDDFSRALSDCSVVWFVEDDRLPLPRALLHDKINQAVAQNKKIIYTRYSNQEEYLDATGAIPHSMDITPHINHYNELRFQEFHKSKQWFDNAVPVLIVLGTAENTGKFEVQTALRKQFLAMDYQVTSISSRRDSDILGMHPMPDFMWAANISEEEKILRFKWFVKQLELEEQPDIIIIGIPGGAIPYSRKKHNHFGVFAFEISMAIECDCAVLCSLVALHDKNYFRDMGKTIRDKFNIPVEYHHMAACMSYTEEARFPGEFNFISLSDKSVRKAYSAYKSDNPNLYYASDANECERLTESIIDRLSSTNVSNILTV